MSEVFESLLVFDPASYNVPLLDRVVNVFYNGKGDEQVQAQQILNQIRENENSWLCAAIILQQSQNFQTKYIALQILEKLIQTRWKLLTTENKDGIKHFIVHTIIQSSSTEEALNNNKVYLRKLNLVLVQILKQEWPTNWKEFIPEILASSQVNLSLCQNTMQILKLLSEEVYDFSAEQMTQEKTKAMKEQLSQEFSRVFQLCRDILEKTNKPGLITVTLEAFLKFLNWIPLGYVFETNIIETIINRFFPLAEFRNPVIKCLTEIASLKTQAQVPEAYETHFVSTLELVLKHLSEFLPPTMDIRLTYKSATSEDQDFIQNLALFFSAFLGSHLKTLEIPEYKDYNLLSHYYLIKIAQVEDKEIFKICLEYFGKLVADLYFEMQRLPISELSPMLSMDYGSTLSSGGAPDPQLLANIPLRKHIYSDVLSNLRLVMIERMAKPEEVLIVENDEGEIVREFVKETDTIVLYKSMREVLVYLTHLDVLDTERIMNEKLAKQVDGSEWSWANCNCLCWAIGSISGAMNEDTEKKFLVNVIKELLGLTEMKRGKDNKAVVASAIMYIVGQYPRFLKAHWKFLKTVVNKLFEFMHESHEGVQDMACDTFITIAQKCKRHFVAQQNGEDEPFINVIIRELATTTSDLTPQQIHTFYEACGYMISAQSNRNVQAQLISELMALPNEAWNTKLKDVFQNINELNNPETIKLITNILKTNHSACYSIGSYFYPQIMTIYKDALALYKVVSEIVSMTIERDGALQAKTPLIRGLRASKRETLKLIDLYIEKSDDLELVHSTLVDPLFDTVLLDYRNNVPDAREAEVLNLMTTIITKLQGLMNDKISHILAAVFECTLDMISKDLSEFPEHRIAFFNLLRAINQKCFPALLSLSSEQLKLVIDSIVWSFKHIERDIQETGLGFMLELLNNFSNVNPQVANVFYSQYYLSILQDIFFVLTDSDHKAGFKLQSHILARMIQIVENGQIQVPLYTSEQTKGLQPPNNEFLRNYLSGLLKNAFPNLTKSQVISFVNGLFEYKNDLAQFKLNLRDFLVQLKEFTKDDDTELFRDEKEEELAEKQKQEREKAMQVPGMLKPSELNQEENEL